MAWKFVVPKQGDPTTKKFENRMYYWCPKHQYFTMHKSEECRGVDFKKRGKTRDAPIQANTAAVTANDQGKQEKKHPLVKVNDALRAYIESTDDHLS
jgi:hypothetical protein